MPKLSMKRLALVFFLVNLVAIGASIISGYRRGNVAFRFEEKQAITFFSSNQLAATSLLAWIIYLLKRKLITRDGAYNRTALFWAISAFGFFYLMLDENFQIHEGMDTSLFRLFGHYDNPMVWPPDFTEWPRRRSATIIELRSYGSEARSGFSVWAGFSWWQRRC
jgi:hypothetical protein